MCIRVSLRLASLQQQSRAVSTQSKSIVESNVHFMCTTLVRNVVEITIRIFLRIINGWGNESGVNRQSAHSRLESTGRALCVTDHRLGRTHRHTVRMVTEH